jgi:hypothetical protein
LIDPNFRRRDVYLVEVRVDPFDDRACSTCCPDAGRFVEDGVRDADRRPQPQQQIKLAGQGQRDQR